MDPEKPKERKPWQPRMDKLEEFDPFVRTTEPGASIDNRTLEEIEAETSESEAREDEAEPIKVPGTSGPTFNK